MDTLVALAAATGTAFLLNVAPALVPPTAAVMAFVYIHYHLPLALLSVAGGVASGIGRLTLALISRDWGTRLLSPKRQGNLELLGHWLDGKSSRLILLISSLAAIGPVPSNAVFIAAGLVRMRLAALTAGFILGRIANYYVLSLLSKQVVASIRQLVLQHWQDPLTIALNILIAVGVIAFALIDWPKLLHLPGTRR